MKALTYIPPIIISVLLLSSCASVGPSNSMQTTFTERDDVALRDTHERLNGVLWMQTSAEYQVLYKVAYKQARESVGEALRDPKWNAVVDQIGESTKNLTPAIIVDIDETVLDNSKFQGQLVLNRSGYSSDLWDQWVKLHAATSTPGSVDFLRWASSKNISIFYITNREIKVERETIQNLISENFPNVSQETVLSKGEIDNSSDKKARRAFVARNHRIILLVGDDLGDFVSGAKDSPENRIALANKYSSYWGTRWILLPNALYGSWESALYGNDFSKSDNEQLIEKMSTVQGFK